MCFLLLFKHMTIEPYQVCVSARPALSGALSVKQVDGPSSPAPTSYCYFFTGYGWMVATSSLLQRLCYEI